MVILGREEEALHWDQHPQRVLSNEGRKPHRKADLISLNASGEAGDDGAP